MAKIIFKVCDKNRNFIRNIVFMEGSNEEILKVYKPHKFLSLKEQAEKYLKDNEIIVGGYADLD